MNFLLSGTGGQSMPDMLAAAGIDSNKVKVQVVDGKVIITKE